MLKACLGQPDVAAATQADAADPLRDRPLNPRTPRVLCLPLRRLLLPAGRLQRLVQRSRAERHLTPLRPGTRAERPAEAGQALAPRELGVDHLVAPAIEPRRPHHGRPALWACHAPGLP